MRYAAIIVIVLAFVVLAAIYSVVTPLGEGPDEPGHARYMFFLAREGRLPVQRADSLQSDVPGEGHQPPLAYVLMAPLAVWLPREERQFDLPGNARFTWAGGGELNAVAHGSREYLPWRGFVLAWHLARLVSVALGAATVVFTYLAAKDLEKRLEIGGWRLGADQPPISHSQPLISVLVAGLVAFNPQFVFTSALVTNDALLVTLSAALLWLAVCRPTLRLGSGQVTDDRQASIGSTITYAIVIGAVLGLALIAKQSAIILAPVAFLAVLQHSRSVATPTSERVGDGASGRVGAGSSPRRPVASWPHRLSLSIFAVVTLLVSGWWYARNLRLYGDLFGLAAFQAEFLTQPFDATDGRAWAAALAQLHASFWARFGWMNVSPPGWVIGIFALVELLALLGWIKYADERRRMKDERGLVDASSLADERAMAKHQGSFFDPSFLVLGRSRWWPILALPLLAFGWVVSFALTAGLVAWQGRLLFPALPAIAIGLAFGLSAWQNRETRTENRKLPDFKRFLLLGSWFSIALWLPFGVIRPAYPFHTLPEARALERLGSEVYGRFGVAGEPGAELRGWRLSGQTRPGDTPELTLIWHALGRQNRDWTVFIHLVDAQEQIVAEDNRPPQDGAFPMLQWVAGDWIEDGHPLALPAGLAPGEYRIRVGLFYPPTDRRAGMYSKRGRLRGDYLDIGSLIVEG